MDQAISNSPTSVINPPLWVRAVVFGVAYFVCAMIGIALSLKPGPFISFWLPSGLFVATLLMHERNHWPIFVLAGLLANTGFDLYNGQALQISLLFFLANSLDAIIGASLVQRFVAKRPSLRTTQELIGLLGLTMLSAALGATLGAGVVSYLLRAGSYGSTWLLWWSGDVLGIFLITPLIFSWRGMFRRPWQMQWSRQRAEEAIYLGVIILGSLVIFYDPWHHNFSLLYLTIPAVLFGAFRFGLPLATLGTLLVAVIAAWNTMNGLSQISVAGLSVREQALALQLFLATLASSGMVTATLISERKQSEEAAQQASRRLEGILEGTHVGTWEWDVSTGAVVFNETWAEYLGHTLADLAPISIKTWETLCHPDDLKVSGDLLLRHFAGEFPYYDCECRMKHKDGHWVWVHDRGRLLSRTGDGQPLLMFGTHADISSRKQAEEALRSSEARFRTLFEVLPVGATLTNPSGHILMTNPASEALLGIPSDDLLRRDFQGPYWDIVRPDGSPMPPEEYAGVRALDESRIVHNMEMGVHRPDGQTAWINVTATPIDNPDLGVVIVYSDITARKEAEAALARLQDQNYQLQKAESLGRMAASIAHHFNNKLHAVMANLELLSALPKGGDPTKLLALAKLASEKAAAVSRQMLVYQGNSPGVQEPLFLGELCMASLPLLQQTLSGGVQLEGACPTPGPIIKANAEQLQQVMTNLVINAGEAMDTAGGVVRLSLSSCPAAELPTDHRFPIGWQPQGPDYACLEVADTGAGIAGADIEKLFDPFFSTKFTGRGLGLPVVLGLVQAHGGALAVSSQLGQGSVFRVYLPVATEAAPSLPERADQANDYEGGGTLLLVDDDDMLLMATGVTVELLGFTLLTAKDGVEALEVYRQHRADIRCVVTDLTMPRLDGWGLLTALRQLDPSLPVILASGYDKTQVLAGTHPDQPQAFLSKPFTHQQLRDALGQALAAS